MIRTITLIVIILTLSGCGRCYLKEGLYLAGSEHTLEQEYFKWDGFGSVPDVVYAYKSPNTKYKYYPRGTFNKIDILRWLHEQNRVVIVYPTIGRYHHAIAVHNMSDIQGHDIVEVHVASN